MLFFSKEEFEEEPLKDILDSYQVTKTVPLSQSKVHEEEERNQNQKKNQIEFPPFLLI